MLFSRNYWRKEWASLEKKERRYLKRRSEERSFAVMQKIAEKVPAKLEGTLKAAFYKAFELVFEKGIGVIEKTFDKEKQEQSFQINEYAVRVRNDKKSIKAFSRQAGSAQVKNLLLSGIEGAGLGVLGIGLPDILLFTAVLLKSVYEIALGYGCSYDTEEEQCFILKLIETSLLRGEELCQANEELNEWIESEVLSVSGSLPISGIGKKEQIIRTSDALAEALLYMKFIQGIPVVGLAGGLADAVYLKKITDYADLKYKRRCYCRFRKEKGPFEGCDKGEGRKW